MSDARTITTAELETMLDEAAARGAQKALRDLGLNDENAQTDVRDLRNLLTSWRELRQEALKAVVKLLTTALLGAIMIGVGFKLGATKLIE